MGDRRWVPFKISRSSHIVKKEKVRLVATWYELAKSQSDDQMLELVHITFHQTYRSDQCFRWIWKERSLIPYSNAEKWISWPARLNLCEWNQYQGKRVCVWRRHISIWVEKVDSLKTDYARDLLGSYKLDQKHPVPNFERHCEEANIIIQSAAAR